MIFPQMRFNRTLLFFLINLFCFVIEGSVGCKRDRNGENVVLFPSSSRSTSPTLRDLLTVRSGALSRDSSLSSYGAETTLALRSQLTSSTEEPLLRLDQIEPVLRPIGPIIGDVLFEKSFNEKALNFYTRMLRAQENEIISSFCAQINMEPTYWPALIYNLKKSMKWPGLYRDELVFCDDVSSYCDFVQKYLKGMGCGKVPVVYSDSCSNKGTKLSVRGVTLHVCAKTSELELNEDLKGTLDYLALYFQNNDAFHVHVMHQQILKAPASKQPALEKIMNLYALFALRRNDIGQVFCGCDKKRSDESCSVDYIKELVQHIQSDAGVVVNPWLQECEAPVIKSKDFKCAVCSALCSTKMKFDHEVTESLEGVDCCDRCWADMDRDERVF